MYNSNYKVLGKVIINIWNGDNLGLWIRKFIVNISFF